MIGYENLFVIYPPALGGNHLGNLLSLSPRYAERFDIASYDQNVSAAHFSYIMYMNLDQIRNNLDRLTTQSNVWNGHYLEYQKFRESDLGALFPNKRFLAIQMPEPGTLAHDRMTRGNPTGSTTYLMREITSLYQVQNISMLCHETDRPWYVVDPNLLFAPDLSALFADLSRQGFEIEVDMDLVNSLHAKWFNRL